MTVNTNPPAPPPAASQPTAPIVYGPLTTARTISITMAPDWSQEAIGSPIAPSVLKILLGPANSTPNTAPISFAYRIYSFPQSRPLTVLAGQEEIKTRAFLWYEGRPFGKFKNCVEASGCKLSDPDIKLRSITMRPFSSNKAPSLVWNNVMNSPEDTFLAVQEQSRYYVNLTFLAGSTIAQKVAYEGWKPTIHLETKNPSHPQLTFANFVTNWSNGVELDPEQTELRDDLNTQQLHPKPVLKHLPVVNTVPAAVPVRPKSSSQAINRVPVPAIFTALPLNPNVPAVLNMSQAQKIEMGKNFWRESWDSVSGLAKSAFSPTNPTSAEEEGRKSWAEMWEMTDANIDFAAKVEGKEFSEAMQEFFGKINPEDQRLINRTLKKYTIPAGFGNKLYYVVNRIWNAIKALFGKSDWKIAHRLFKTIIEMSSWFRFLQKTDSGSIASRYMLKHIYS